MSAEILSILNSTKKALGLDAEYDVFDSELIMFINGVLSILTQLGVGPAQGFMIASDAEGWSSFLGDDPRRNAVKNFVFIKVRLLFDPPPTSYAITAFEKQAEELGWRINVQREDEEWTAASP